MNFWDQNTSQYEHVNKVFFRKTSAAILVYDITNPQSLDFIINYMEKCKDQLQSSVRVVVANKVDIESQNL